MNNKKRIFALAAVICVLSGSMAYAQEVPENDLAVAPISTEVQNVANGAKVAEAEAIDVNGIRCFPLRAVAEELGYTVEWHAEGRTISLTRGAQYITMRIDEDSYAFSRRAPESLGMAPTLVGDSTYVPYSFVENIIGGYAEVNENGTYKIVIPAVVTVKEVYENGSVLVSDDALGDVLLVMGEGTQIVGESDIKAGDTLQVEYSDAMTASIPAQNAPVKVIIANLPADTEENEGEEETVAAPVVEGIITETEDGMITVGTAHVDANAMRLVITEETVIKHAKDRRIYKAEDLTVGMHVTATHDEAVTMSIPAQSVAYTVIINDAPVADEEQDNETEAEVKSVELSGSVSEITEDGMIVVKKDDNDKYGTALIVTDNTVIRHATNKRIYKAEDLEQGMEVEVMHSSVMTKSLPAQTEAFEIIIK